MHPMDPGGLGAPPVVFSEEEALLAHGAAEWLGKHSDFSTVRRLLVTESGFDPGSHAQLAQLGWLGIGVPEAYGGSGLPLSTLTAVVEQMGRHLCASPLLACTLAAQALVHAGNAGQKAWLGKLASGEAIGTVAITEPSGSWELRDLTATLTRSGSEIELAGTKTLVLDALHADFVVAVVLDAGAPALVLVPRAALTPERVRRELLIDETRRSARIRLDGIKLPRSAVLDGGDAELALRAVRHAAWLLLSAEMAGGAEGVLQLTVDYLKTRRQFGKPIGSYQALKHPCVEIMCLVEEGRSLLYRAATALARGDGDTEVALRSAKAQLGATFTHAADRAIQFHGAIGFTYECHAQLFFRRAQLAEHSWGDSRHHRRHLARLLLGG